MAERLVVRRTATLLGGRPGDGRPTACSGTKSYCSALKDDKKQLTRLSKESAKPGKAGDAGARRHVDRALRPARRRARRHRRRVGHPGRGAAGPGGRDQGLGADPSDFAGGQTPDGVTAGQLKAVQEAADRAAEHPGPAGRRQHRAARARRLQGRSGRRARRRRRVTCVAVSGAAAGAASSATLQRTHAHD